MSRLGSLEAPSLTGTLEVNNLEVNIEA